jgi:hypothetical protein
MMNGIEGKIRLNKTECPMLYLSPFPSFPCALVEGHFAASNANYYTYTRAVRYKPKGLPATGNTLTGGC